MMTVLDVGGVSVDVVRKDIKNLHLSVHPPTGRVRIAAPRRVRLDAIHAFAVAHLGWIRRNQRKHQMQERETPREYLDRESHFVWGERVLLKVVEREATPQVARRLRKLVLTVRPGADTLEREDLVERWYRDELRHVAEPIVRNWEKRLAVTTNRVFVQRMKTKWGSCNPSAGNIRLNTELAKKPPECLNYVVLHELLHFRVRTHSPRFHALLDQNLPHWREVRRVLNELPLGSGSTPAG